VLEKSTQKKRFTRLPGFWLLASGFWLLAPFCEERRLGPEDHGLLGLCKLRRFASGIRKGIDDATPSISNSTLSSKLFCLYIIIEVFKMYYFFIMSVILYHYIFPSQ
jgi:hypothetical protein